MNWSEFKEEVDKKFKEQNIDPNTPIFYVDVNYPSKENIEIELGDDDEIMVINNL